MDSRVSDEAAAGVLELEGLAMAGLVAILRQLGDLAELAAEVFDGLQHQVMAVSARRRRLAVRAKQLINDLPTSSSIIIVDGHHRCGLKNKKALVHGAGVVAPPPRFVVNQIKRCRGPPRLSLLDRFDADGEGACLKRMRRTGCMIDGSLHNKPENSYSEDTIRVDTLVPIPPMQWLSVKVHTGPIRNTYRKPFGKYHVQRAESKIRTTTELLHSCEAWSEPRGTKHLSAAEINYLQQQPRQQLVAADCNMQAPERPAKKVSEIISPSRGNNTVSDLEAEKNSNANATQQVDVHNTSSGEGDEGNLQQHDEENVWFASAMEQLARMSPPWLPRPKHHLPNNQGMVSHDRVTV
ncbi:hypothetical protein HU200_012708 [Digitaria exilis]|uniref:Protein SCAR n=1 Tax=Digitaria exilis TaxID=1010633 RepID=A0A835KLN1_9POAL|nr:hypothetical protein HU200_012708 [Digitaria exilis]